MTEGMIGKLLRDRGYISHKLFEQLHERGLQLITKLKKNMKNKLVQENKSAPVGSESQTVDQFIGRFAFDELCVLINEVQLEPKPLDYLTGGLIVLVYRCM